MFFPPASSERHDERHQREARAKSICRQCPVQPECLEHAMQFGEAHGIWGGLNEHERRSRLEASYS